MLILIMRIPFPRVTIGQVNHVNPIKYPKTVRTLSLKRMAWQPPNFTVKRER